MRVLGYLFGTLMILLVAGVLGTLYVLHHFGQDLPDYRQLATYEPPVTTRVHAADGSVIAEFARERRLFVPITAIPQRVIRAFLSAEDKGFYEHAGIDIPGIINAALTNMRNPDRRPIGASTITQQVAKNFLLGNEVSMTRKLKEAILAFRIERAFTKDRILELYLNQIYLGQGSYGVAAAALNYFDKALDDLTVAEAAYLAALPKAPNNYHPVREREAAVARRNWVLDRMRLDGAVTQEEWEQARTADLGVRPRTAMASTQADYFAEEVRREVMAQFDEKTLYEGGLSVRTTLDPHMQAIADRALRQGLIAYDRRHGWRGPLGHVEPGEGWQERLAQEPPLPALDAPGIGPWQRAMVLEAGRSLKLGFSDGTQGTIAAADMAWAGRTGLKAGDLVAVEAKDPETRAFALRQIPAVRGALVAMDPHTGRVVAMVGGWSYAESEFNRATQALRQPGSSFKPFVYATALEQGFTPSSLVLDGPFVASQGPGLPLWRPANYSHDFLGPATLRVGLAKSRNLMTVRLAHYIGMENVADLVARMGVMDRMVPRLSMSLGAGESTVLRMTTGYAEFVNGGKRIVPTLIDRIQDRRGRTIYRHDDRPCDGCTGTTWYGQDVPGIPDVRAQVISAASAYQITSMLQGVVDRGTGGTVRAVGKPLGGKTGTSNDAKDVWFVGFSPDLAVGVYVGFDQPKSLGGRETGGSVAAPIFRDFMKEALADAPAIPFRIPPGVRLVRVDPGSGLPVTSGGILEAFKPGTEPFGERNILDGSENLSMLGGDENDFDLGPGPDVNSGVDLLDTSAATGGLY
ncbi:penicillin-binding protein 1A [Zavarzinia sp. CC-PAN008]|uniref:penicillin-binding protein 1A n=1 Tax=Zavarzinia sp. CC-PAN008 TaxID=3243332 RepID=UPI003F743E60